MLRKIIGFVSRILAPHYGGCLRCGVTWRFTEHHTTYYYDRAGCFPLCSHCWRCLTPDERLHYYHQLVFDEWQGEGSEDWPAIKRAVLEGK